MEPFKKISSIVAPLDRVNVDTDAIIPKQFLKRIERTGFGQFLFYEWRFDEQDQEISNFVLNQARYKNAQILLSRANFGCGSSREHAPWALLDYGFKVVIAPSFADIFYNNCFKNGILPIQLSEDEVEQLFQKTTANEGYTLTVNLETQTVSDQGDIKLKFQIDPYRKNFLIQGLDDIAITLDYDDQILAYEAAYPSYYLISEENES